LGGYSVSDMVSAGWTRLGLDKLHVKDAVYTR